MNFSLCTSETCKVIVLVFAIFLAGYMIWTNSNNSLKEMFDEDNKNLDASTDSGTDDQIKSIYSQVYFKDISDATLKAYKDEMGTTNTFDPNSFKDTLTADRKNEVNNMIRNVFQEQLNRSETPEERETYTNSFMTNKMHTKEDIVAALSASPEMATKDIDNKDTRQTKKDNAMQASDYARYKTIIDTYQKSLDRLPSSVELNHYFKIFTKDATFTPEKLEDALLASREHTILEKNQQNLVQGELMGNITERQLEIMVTDLYKSVYQVEPDPSTYKFLKNKFVGFDLNEEAFIKFLKQLKQAELDATGTRAINNGSDQDKYHKSDAYGGNGGNSANEDVYNKYVSQKPDLLDRTMDKPSFMDNDRHPQDSHTNGDQKNGSKDNSKDQTFDGDNGEDADSINVQKTIDAIKQGPACRFDRNKLDNDQAYAHFVNQRNDDDCKGGQYLNAYKSKNDNMVLIPGQEWSVPQRKPPVCYGNFDKYNPMVDQSALIGTLLKEADKTQVGSIMPKFSYKQNDGLCYSK